MSDFIKINGRTIFPTSRIRTISELSDEEKERITSKYENADGSVFNSKLEIVIDNETRIVRNARETIADLEAQGVAFVTIVKGCKVPAANIFQTDDYTAADRDRSLENGLTLTRQFRTRVHTTAGIVLSTVPATQLWERVQAAKAKVREVVAQADAAKETGPDQGPKAAPGT